MIPDLVLYQVARAGEEFNELEATTLIGKVLALTEGVGVITSASVQDRGQVLMAEIRLGRD